MKGGTLLITGATGFTGRHAARHFVEAGLQVVALTRREDEALSQLGVQVVVCDLLSATDVERVINHIQPHYALHLAGMNAVPDSWSDPVLAFQINVVATLHLLNALRVVPQCRILIATSKLKAPVHPSFIPPHPYAFSKSLQEVVALGWSNLFQQDICLVEPSNLVGPGASNGLCGLLGRYTVQCERRASGADIADATGSRGAIKPFYLSSRSALRDFLDVRDAVAAYEMVFEHGIRGNTYVVESRVKRSLGSVAELFIRSALVSIQVEIGNEQEQIVITPPMEEEDRATPHAWGWKPLRSFEHSVSDILNYYRHEWR
ncbi:NAD-dependent epimerase/dehydratase family protein [Paenibacillus sp. 481]|uniref:NAD-dependent epimerase/dehydratase family protein n=1 Tax=Paenibacillus sp. 481 TaxID=2835869 RepID=UPI001E45CA8D|nr:NAD-dependent epimerase/dehydratase family protein [Paenibacillus sp. 481]UHA74494.1 NAD-dependent epimerase/dehydratase family protein [Paenibacillus sp. 481]